MNAQWQNSSLMPVVKKAKAFGWDFGSLHD